MRQFGNTERRDDDPPKRRSDFATVRTLLPYLWPKDAIDVRARVIISLFLLMVAKLATVAVPVALKYAVDDLSLTKEEGLIAVPVALLLAYGAARILSTGLKELQGAIFARVAERAIRDVGLKTFRHLHRLALRFHLDRQTGGLSRAIERGARGIEFVLRVMLFNIIPTAIEIVMVTIILWQFLDPGFAIATLLTVGIYVVWTLVVTEWRTKYRRQMNDSDSEAHTKAIDSLLNYETVKYFGNEEHEARRFDRALGVYEKNAIQSKVSLSILNAGQGTVIAIGVTIVMLMAASGVAAGTMTIGDFVLVNTYLLQLYLPLNFLGSVYREIKYSLIDMESMFSLLDENVEVSDSLSAKPLSVTGGSVRFENVSFGYDPRRTVLKGIDFTVPEGKSVAIVGPSGAGKSTISRLLFRFYDATKGRITIDGQDICEVTQDSLRAAIGIVPQDTVLFNDSIYYNIAYGRPQATPSEVEEAARLARIHDFIGSLPDGYQSIVGERGLKLSGGEKQRVAIARTILKRPKILLFDEATSALDSHTEKEIQASLKEVAAGHTTLMIAHRLSTVVEADEILVLEDGHISERGSHGDLMAQNGAYAAMWARQQEAARALEKLEHVGEEVPAFQLGE